MAVSTRTTKLITADASFQAEGAIFFFQKAGEDRDERRCQRAARDQIENQIGITRSRDECIVRIARTESARDQNLPNQTDDVAQYKCEHHRPGGAGDLTVGRIIYYGLFHGMQGLYHLKQPGFLL